MDSSNKVINEKFSNYLSKIPEKNRLLIENILKQRFKRGQKFDGKDELSLLLIYAVENNDKNLIEKLIEEPEFNINMLIDEVNKKTLLAKIIFYPFYSDLFKLLIDRGAKIFKEAKYEDFMYRSNALMLSVHYSEFDNLEYLLDKMMITFDELLSMCIEKKNFVLLRHFLEKASPEDAIAFINKKSDSKNIERVQKVLDEHLKNLDKLKM